MYILASYKNGTLYTGVTGNLVNRISIHKNDIVNGFTKRFAVHNLVYLEEFEEIHQAIAREKQLKHWKREWKIELIEGLNPDWKDLSEELSLN